MNDINKIDAKRDLVLKKLCEYRNNDPGPIPVKELDKIFGDLNGIDSVEDLISCLMYLNDNGYISCSITRSLGGGGRTNIGSLDLSSAGVRYIEDKERNKS